MPLVPFPADPAPPPPARALSPDLASKTKIPVPPLNAKLSLAGVLPPVPVDPPLSVGRLPPVADRLVKFEAEMVLVPPAVFAAPPAPIVIDNVVRLLNENILSDDIIGSMGCVDDYLLNEGDCTQEDREIICEQLFHTLPIARNKFGGLGK